MFCKTFPGAALFSFGLGLIARALLAGVLGGLLRYTWDHYHHHHSDDGLEYYLLITLLGLRSKSS